MSDHKHDEKKESTSRSFWELVDIIHRLRAPDGCPWDREQTAASLKPYIIEEAYETIDAIDNGSSKEICEELGDLLLQVVLQSEIANEKGDFAISDVIQGISRKLIGRHPHVFGDVEAKDAKAVLINWELIKKKEKADKGLFDGLPKHLPALQTAARMGEKAGRVGFDWPDALGVRAKVTEELNELDEAIAGGDADEVEHELGDVLFAVAQWARHLGQHPEESLREACQRFSMRFSLMEKSIVENGETIDNLNMNELEMAWQRAKSQL